MQTSAARLGRGDGPADGRMGLPTGGTLGASLLGVNLSPDGKRLYVYGAIRIGSIFNKNVRGVPGLHVLDAATGKKLHTWEGAGYPAGTTAHGKEVITFREGSEITAHDAQTGKPVRTFPLSGFVSSVVLSPDGKTIAAVGVTGHPDRGHRLRDQALGGRHGPRNPPTHGWREDAAIGDRPAGVRGRWQDALLGDRIGSHPAPGIRPTAGCCRTCPLAAE